MLNDMPLGTLTDEELATARAAVQRDRDARALLEADGAPEDPFAEVDEVATEDEDTDDAPEPEPWPHETIEYAGHTFEVRTPDASALMAVSMTTMEGIPATLQLAVFARFLTAHMSPRSFTEALTLMADPATGVATGGLVTELTKLATQ